MPERVVSSGSTCFFHKGPESRKAPWHFRAVCLCRNSISVMMGGQVGSRLGASGSFIAGPLSPAPTLTQFEEEGIPVASAHPRRCSPSLMLLMLGMRTQTINPFLHSRSATINELNCPKGGRCYEQARAWPTVK